MPVLLHEIIVDTCARSPNAVAMRAGDKTKSYQELNDEIDAVAGQIIAAGAKRADRVAIFLEKRFEAIIGMFATSRADGAFVPINPQLKGEQLSYIANNCDVKVLITSKSRLKAIGEHIYNCASLATVILVDGSEDDFPEIAEKIRIMTYDTSHSGDKLNNNNIDCDVAAILYTSGSTGKPKGVVLSHRNIIVGAESVSTYLENTSEDKILSVLPLSFDYGMSQVTTAFLKGAELVLLNYLLPRDVIKAVAKFNITGLAAVPPLWIQIAQLEWPEEAKQSLRYITNSGGAMPLATLKLLQEKLPETKPYLMYGLTEAFRSSYLPPAEIKNRPESMGKAIPNAELKVVRPDGSECDVDEPGELVHRGALVSLGYWDDEKKTAERFKPWPGQSKALPHPELAVWSGDQVRQDKDGFLYFVSRQDEMMKTSGFRVSPTEVEEILYETKLIGEAVVFGMKDLALGQAIIAIVTAAPESEIDIKALKKECMKKMPSYMVPSEFVIKENLPRNPNGKLDRKTLTSEVTAELERSKA